MALTAAEWTRLHQREQIELRELTVRDVARLAHLLRYEALDESFPAFARAVAVLVRSNRRTSAGMAAGYLRAVRLLAGARGELSVITPAMILDDITASLHVTTVAGGKKAAARGETPEVAKPLIISAAGGAMARHVLAGGRGVIGATVAADPYATGWRRVASGGNSCDFCRSLDGEIYPSSVTDFECHDRCGCSMAPIWA